jgi:hypothetical protein
VQFDELTHIIIFLGLNDLESIDIVVFNVACLRKEGWF